MPAHRTARERARAELTTAIKDEARRQLAEVGASGLSLRAVARELGMVSSAVYRYFPSRDELLTALIVDTYTTLGDTLEVATAGAGSSPAEQWQAAAHALRDWAREYPHEYSLLYGTPVPDYDAPQDTVGPAGRIPGTFLRILEEDRRDSVDPDRLEPQSDHPLATQSQRVVDALGLHGMPATAVLDAVDGWTQLFGAIALELNGQFVGSFDPADEYFTYVVERQIRALGLS